MRVLILDHNPQTPAGLPIAPHMQQRVWRVVSPSASEAAVGALELKAGDMVIVDAEMSRENCLDVLRHISEVSSRPALMHGVSQASRDNAEGPNGKTVALTSDPFTLAEAIAQVSSILFEKLTPVESPKSPLVCGELVIDYGSRNVNLGGKPVRLTHTEYRLLCVLAQYHNQVVTRQAIVERVWGTEYRRRSDILKVYIRRLRRKMEKDTLNSLHIVTERGKGYGLVTFHKTPQRRVVRKRTACRVAKS